MSTDAATRASRTIPTLWVLVIATGDVSRPDFADPLEAGQLAVAVEAVAAGEDGFAPGLRAARRDDGHAGPDGPVPTTSGPSPEISVVWPTRTPATSVMALSGPGTPRPIVRPRSRKRIRGC